MVGSSFVFSFFFFSSRRRHTRWTGDWSSDVCSSDLGQYAIYNWEEEDDPAELLDRRSPHYAVKDEHGELIGFFAYGSSAYVWDGGRSEERRVGKECRSGGWMYDDKRRRQGDSDGMSR